MKRTWIVALAAVAALTAACQTTAASHPATTTAPKPTSTTPPLPPATVTPDPSHVATLNSVIQRFNGPNAAKLREFVPGAEDVFDYGIDKLWQQGIDGTGTTIALVEGWNDPNLTADLDQFDSAYGLPNPQVTTIYPTGNGQLPAQCPPGMVKLGSYGSCQGWAGELELDVMSAHLIAPYANILLVVTPADSEITDDDASQVAPPEMMAGVEYVAAHHLADVVAISDGTGEGTYSYGAPEIHAQDPGELAAAAAGIPMVVGTGDCGVVQNLAVASSQCGNVSSGPQTAAWDDSPWVTALGGSVPNLSPTTGARQGPDTVWQEGIAAEGAGSSAIYARPAYQNGVVTGSMRAVPDITMDAREGTSEAGPLFGGVLALATQLNHAPIGPVNPVLYQVLGPHGSADGITDIVSGSNSVTGHPGLSAGPGFDAATGWGTLDAATFVPALVTAVRAQPTATAPVHQAETALAQLETAAKVAPATVASTATTQLTATGFLPNHPVTLTIDNRAVATLTATTTGTITYQLNPKTLTLNPGKHTLTLHSMLITEHTTFRTT